MIFIETIKGLQRQVLRFGRIDHHAREQTVDRHPMFVEDAFKRLICFALAELHLAGNTFMPYGFIHQLWSFHHAATMLTRQVPTHFRTQIQRNQAISFCCGTKIIPLDWKMRQSCVLLFLPLLLYVFKLGCQGAFFKLDGSEPDAYS